MPGKNSIICVKKRAPGPGEMHYGRVDSRRSIVHGLIVILSCVIGSFMRIKLFFSGHME